MYSTGMGRGRQGHKEVKWMVGNRKQEKGLYRKKEWVKTSQRGGRENDEEEE